MKTSLVMSFSFKCIHTVPGEVDASGELMVHGHNYALKMKFTRTSDEFQDWVASRDLVQQEVKAKVLPYFHNKDLDIYMKPATGENMCLKIKELMEQSSLYPYLSEIELEETRKNTFNLVIRNK